MKRLWTFSKSRWNFKPTSKEHGSLWRSLSTRDELKKCRRAIQRRPSHGFWKATNCWITVLKNALDGRLPANIPATAGRFATIEPAPWLGWQNLESRQSHMPLEQWMIWN